MAIIKTYTVQSRAFQWGKWSEWTDEGKFYAPTNQGAKAQARAKAMNAGWTRQDGKLEFRAQCVSQA